MEQWRQIVGFSNYEVSSLGRIRSKPRKRTRGGLVKQTANCTERLKVEIYDNNHNRHTVLVHRLVANHFLPNFFGKPQVDHVNGNFLDNRVINLRWATERENLLNTKLRKDNTSGEKHISFDNSRKKWMVQIHPASRIDIKKRFKTKEEAIKFRDEMVKIHYDPNFYRSG